MRDLDNPVVTFVNSHFALPSCSPAAEKASA